MPKLTIAHAASYSHPREPLPTDRYLLTALAPNARVHCQRRLGRDSARIESDAPVVMEIGRRQPDAPRGRLVSTLLHMAHSVLEGPMTRRSKRTSPGLLRRELKKAFHRLSKSRALQPEVSMAVMHRDNVAVASNGGALLLKLGSDGLETVAADSPSADSQAGRGQVGARIETLDPGDRLILVSPTLADCLEARDFESRRLESASPKRLTTYLLDLARARGCRSASVIASAQGDAVEPVSQVRKSIISTVAMPMGLGSRPAAVA